MAKKLQDIAGFRQSHRRIPTNVALADDENEMAARSGAIDRLGLKDKKPGRVPLKDFGFNMGMARRTVQPSDDDTSLRQPSETDTSLRNPMTPEDRDATPLDRWSSDEWEQRWLNQPEVFTSFTPPEGVDNQGNPIDPTNRDLAQQILEGQYDPEERERRIARARAAQEAMVRSTMGAGEAGRSGAAALLQGEAGRLAESQARIAEMQRELGLADLAMYLEGFDLAKDRYDDADKRQAAMAAIYTSSIFDLDYEGAMNLLQIPKSAWTPEGKEAHENWLAQHQENEDAEGELDSYTGGNTAPSGTDVYAWAGNGTPSMSNDSGFDAWMASDGEVNWNGPVPVGYSVPSLFDKGWKELDDGTKMYKMEGSAGVIWVTEEYVPDDYGDSFAGAMF